VINQETGSQCDISVSTSSEYLPLLLIIEPRPAGQRELNAQITLYSIIHGSDEIQQKRPVRILVQARMKLPVQLRPTSNIGLASERIAVLFGSPERASGHLRYRKP
jgi:hypothetical protein